MKKVFIIGFVATLFCGSLFAQGSFQYETVSNDPLKARIYTLENGLKVYLSVYKDQPKIKVTIATKAGSKLDPAETTGLAHYFEHLMFKGTKQFGTTNYEVEKPFLDEIERLFEEYRKIDESKTDERKAMYKKIDSVSQLAAAHAIPNEYDKLMSIVGSTGTNAATWIDFTNYYEEIPSNQLENFFIIQADRFQNPVIRLFHTELETVYEEKNKTLTEDGRRVNAAMMEALFPNHPYGTQTTIGTQKDLRNPSIINIKNFFETYYVPNNMAIIMAGDFDPDEAIAIINKYMGGMKSKPFPEFTFKPEEPIKEPIVREVVGKDAERVMMAWRLGNPNNRKEMNLLTMAEMILTNGHAGLVDLNITKKQRLLNAGSSPVHLHDYTYMILTGSPKAGQNLEEVRDILLEQIDKLAQGDFPDWLLSAVVNDLKQRRMMEIESNEGREDLLTESFYLDIPWETVVNEFDELAKITKEEILQFVKKNLTRDNYVIVYKRKGVPTDIEKVKNPKITPLKINRSDKSDFVKMIEARQVKPIEPLFLDFTKDITAINTHNEYGDVVSTFYHTSNNDNSLFTLTYFFDMGTDNDKELGLATRYLKYLGTDRYTLEQIGEEFYKLGCTFGVSASNNESRLFIEGLSENMEKAVQLMEHIIANAKPNKEALDNLVSDILKQRANAKGNQRVISSYLLQYGVYGVNNPVLATQLSEKELKTLTPEAMIAKLQQWMKYKHDIVYYGNEKMEDAYSIITKNRNLENLQNYPSAITYREAIPEKNKVYIVDFDSPQMSVYGISFAGKYDKDILATSTVYNNYFGGGMNALVFQELREARALAYTAAAFFRNPTRPERLSNNMSFIACGNEKVTQSLEAFKELYDNMPENEASFVIARNAAIDEIRTERITKDEKVWKCLAWKRLGWSQDPRQTVFTAMPNVTFNDIKNFQKQHILGKPVVYMIVGSLKSLDMKYLKKLGKVQVLKPETIFEF